MAVNRGEPLFSFNAVLKVAEAITAVSSSAALDGQLTTPTSLETLVKDVTGSLSPRDVSIINALGREQYIMIERAELSEISFTMVNPTDLAQAESPFEWLYGAAAAVGATELFRINGGEKTSNDRTTKAFYFENTGTVGSGTQIIGFLLNNAFVTDIERSLDAEGSEELSVTVKSLSQDTHIDFDGQA